MNRIFYLILGSALFFACSTQKNTNNCNSNSSEEYIPVDLYDALDYLNCQWSKKEKRKIARIFKDDDLAYIQYEIGKSIRNNWGLWSGENDLVKFFNSHGIFYPDEMSEIILTSFLRKLNKKDIDFEGQIQSYFKLYKIWEEYDEKETKRVLEAYDKYELGDTITLYIEVTRGIDGEIATYTIGPGYEWTFSQEKDLELKGKIIQKEIFQDNETRTNVRLLIQVFDMNKTGIVNTVWQSVKLGDTTKVELKYLKYE